MNRGAVTIKSAEEITKMRKAASMVSTVLTRMPEHIKPGVSTYELDQLAEKWIREAGGKPAFKGYLGYKASICTSINHEVVHGIPSKDRILQEGDIIGVDCGAIWEAYYGDGAYTFAVGKVSPEVQQLLERTQRGLLTGVEQMHPGKRLFDIGAAISAVADQYGYGVVREYVGHGIGTKLHEDPQVPNFGVAGTGMRLKAGMILAIEPMFNLGTHEVELQKDGWTVVTKDHKFSAHFEHTVLITENGPELLTKWP
ncbi:MAG: type I methionyl aminopeptidase [Deltaproteobacteria bacterium]|nr:type I methionyl aminopeptidase [Deltaproteobacteria bacterium]